MEVVLDIYSRFLNEAAKITGNKDLIKVAGGVDDSGKLFTKIGLMFKDAENVSDLEDWINKAGELFLEIAEIEESVFSYLQNKNIIIKDLA